MCKLIKSILGLAMLGIFVFILGYNFDWWSSLTNEETPNPEVSPNPEATPGLRLVNGRMLDPLEIEPWIVSYTNAEREQVGIAPLVDAPAIADIARAHSKNMARQNTQSHVLNGMRATDRARRAGYDCALSENIGRVNRVTEWLGYTGTSNYWPDKYREDEEQVAKALVASWMDSPEHREIMLDSSKHSMGVGVAVSIGEKHGYAREQFWATQNFSGCK